MTKILKQFKTRALALPDVKKAYDDLAEEFAFLDEVLGGRSQCQEPLSELNVIKGPSGD